MNWTKVGKGFYVYRKNGECLGFARYTGLFNQKHDWLVFALGGRIKHTTSLRSAKADLEEKIG